MLEKRVKGLLRQATPRYSRFDSYFNSLTKGLSKKRQPTPRADIRTRHPALLALEGWYDTTEVVVPSKFQELYDSWKKSNSTVKITRWALRNGLLDEEGASELGKSLEAVRFKFSCRHNDLLRLAETHHYASCMDGYNGQQQMQYLADPDIAIVYMPDRAGKFEWRSLVRLVFEIGPEKEKSGLQDEHGNGFALVHYRVYGNGPSQAIFRKLDEKIQVYQARDIRHYHVKDEDTEVKVSPTIHNNRFLTRPIWTDHKGIGWNKDHRIQIRTVTRNGPYEYLKQEVRYLYGYAHP